MPYPVANYPTSIWSGLTENPTRISLNSVVNPNAADWERIATELIAVQEAIGVGGIRPNVFDITSNTTANSTKPAVFLADASAAPLTIFLPQASEVAQVIYDAKKIDATANVVTIQAFGSETIDGLNSVDLVAQYESLTIFSNGTGWFIL